MSIQAVTRAFWLSVSPSCKCCGRRLHCWVSSTEPSSCHQSLPSLEHRLIARVMCGKRSALACTGRMRGSLLPMKVCSPALSTESLLGFVWQAKRGCMRRTHERLRELGFPTVPRVQLVLADFPEDPVEACQQWAQAVARQLEAQTRAEAEELTSKARDAMRVTRSPFSTAGLTPCSSVVLPSARLSFLWLALRPQQLARKSIANFCGSRCQHLTSCMHLVHCPQYHNVFMMSRQLASVG